jgi:hypothetical protein
MDDGRVALVVELEALHQPTADLVVARPSGAEHHLRLRMLVNGIHVADNPHVADQRAELARVVVQEPGQLPCAGDRVGRPHRFGGLTREAARAYEQELADRGCHDPLSGRCRRGGSVDDRAQRDDGTLELEAARCGL